MENRFTLDQIKEEVYYYVGERATTQEAREIQEISNFNKSTPLGEIIEAYYTVDY
jgi:hypothetical protein